jgi:hypothetical protein
MRPQLASSRLLSARTGRPRMPVRPGSVHKMHAASSSSNTRGATGSNHAATECRATRPGAVSKFKPGCPPVRPTVTVTLGSLRARRRVQVCQTALCGLAIYSEWAASSGLPASDCAFYQPVKDARLLGVCRDLSE